MVENNTYPKEIVLCFNLKNQGLRKVLSIKERNNYDLVIMPKYAEHYRETTTIPNNNIKIKHQKYSVHCSPNSNDFNVCMHNLELSDGQIIRNPHYTKTIKSNSGKLAVLYFCRSPDISIDRYILSAKDQELAYCLDEYDHKANTLYYGIFICSNERKSFLTFQTGEQNYKTLNFKNFTVIIVWAYQYLPSHSTGTKLHYFSVDDDKLNQDLGSNTFSTTEGLTGIVAKKITHNSFDRLKQEYVMILLKRYKFEKKYFSIFQLPHKKRPYQFSTNQKK